MRRNLTDHFEAMYLRYNMASKYMSQADQSILDDTQFKKVVSYMTGMYFSRHKDLLLSNGFEFEDIRNIITVFGLTYWGHSKPEARDKKAFMFMMRYIGQRMQTHIRWVSRKFGANEASVITSEHFQFLVDQSTYALYSEHADDSHVSNIEDEISELEVEWTTNDRYTARAIKERKLELAQIRKNKLAQKKADAVLTKTLKARLMANPMQYKEQLCYYATSKHIGKDMRTKARSICTKCGIDYIAWLKEKSISIDFDSSQFTSF